MSARYCVTQSVLCAFYGAWLSAPSGSLSHFWHLKRLPGDGEYAWGVKATLYLSIKLCAGVLLVCLSLSLSVPVSVCPYVRLSLCLSVSLIFPWIHNRVPELIAVTCGRSCTLAGKHFPVPL